MSGFAIQAENLSKRYRIGVSEEKPETLIAAATTWMRSPISTFKRLRRLSNFSENGNGSADIIWALKGVSFEVRGGDVVGVIGRNGAGKTTLLKILSRITSPTSGRALVSGRVSSLLEVGTGFHPELTGRENLYLNGTVLGMSKREVDRKFDEIVDFSGVEKFLDTPIKRYSSGMLVRLAFSVAAHLEPDILLVDEVLAVGDADFQKKCLAKMNSVAKEGRTVMFISHDMGAIGSLTHKCIYLQNGKIRSFSQTSNVVEEYLSESVDQHDPEAGTIDYYRRDALLPDSPAKITRVWVDGDHPGSTAVELGQSFTVFVRLKVFRKLAGAQLTVKLKNVQGQLLTILYSPDQGFFLSLEPGEFTASVIIDNNPLAPGRYFANIGLNQSFQTRPYDVISDYPVMKIVNSGQVTNWPDRPWGMIHSKSSTWNLVD